VTSSIAYRIMLRHDPTNLNPQWIYRCLHPNDGTEHPTATRDRFVAEEAAKRHAAQAHPGDLRDLEAEDD
jgi:hypothetical protein